MNFQEQLDLIIHDYGYLKEKSSYFEDFKSSFLGDVEKNTFILLSKINELKDQTGMWSFVDFVQDNIESKVIPNKFYPEIAEWSHQILLDPQTGKEVRTHIIDVFFYLESDVKVLKEAIGFVLEKYQRFVILERLTARLLKKEEVLPEEFARSLLFTLNVDKERFVGITWYSDLFSTLAKSQYLSFFIAEIQKPDYKTALEEFVDMGDKSSKAFFSSIPKKSIKIVLDFLLKLFQPYSDKDQRSILFDSLIGHSVSEFRNEALEFVVKNTSSLVEFLGKEVLSHFIWDLYPFVSKHIVPADVAKLPDYTDLQKIFWIYEATLQQTQREDLQELKIAFFEINGFDEKVAEVDRLRRENSDKMKESQRIRDLEIRQQIEDASTNIPENQINPGLIDLYERYKDSNDVDGNPYFSGEKKAIVKQFLDTFFSWNLFPVNSLEVEEIKNQDGNKQYRGGPWYAHGFFSIAVRVAKEEFGSDPIPNLKKDILINTLPLLYSDDLKKLIFPHLTSITPKQANTILSFYDGSRKDDLMYFWSGQNFFDIIEQFKKTFVSKTVKQHFQKTLQYWIENDRLYEWNRSEAVRKLGDKELANKNILKYLAQLFEREKHILPENVLANFSRELSYLIAVNGVLIENGHDKAIGWRIHQIKNAKIAMRDPWENFRGPYARMVGDLESELTHDEKNFFLPLKNINVQKYKTSLISLLKYALVLIGEDKDNYALFSRYIIKGVFEIFKSVNYTYAPVLCLSIEKLISKFDSIEVKHSINPYFEDLKGFFVKIYQKNITSPSLEFSLNDNVSVHGQLGHSSSYEEENRKLNSENKDLKQALDELRAKQIEIEEDEKIKERVVFIEGKTGAYHLRLAWEGLYGSARIPFLIENGYHASHIKILLEQSDIPKSIGIFDLDVEGIQQWGSLRNTNMGRFICPVNELRKGMCQYKFLIPHDKILNPRSAILLPAIIDNTVNFGDTLNSNYMGIVGDCSLHKDNSLISVEIEDLYCLVDNRIWDSKYSLDTKTGKASGNKNNMPDYILGRAKKIGIPLKELYSSFRPIFRQILDFFELDIPEKI